jgi:uncharacterized protein HemX
MNKRLAYFLPHDIMHYMAKKITKKSTGKKREQSGAKADHKTGDGVKVGAGIALAAAAAAAAGAYFLYGTKEGKKQRKHIKGWTLKAKGEVLERMEQLQDVNEQTYRGIIDAVSKKYQGLKHIDPSELQDVMTDLKRHWHHIQKQISSEKKTKRTSK